VSPPTIPKVELDEKTEQQLNAIAVMYRMSTGSLVGIAGKYFDLVYAESQGTITTSQYRIESRRLREAVPQEMREEVERAFQCIAELQQQKRRFGYALRSPQD